MSVKEMIQNIENRGQDPNMRKSDEGNRVRDLRDMFENGGRNEEKVKLIEAVEVHATTKNLEIDILKTDDDFGSKKFSLGGTKSRIGKGIGRRTKSETKCRLGSPKGSLGPFGPPFNKNLKEEN